ncbi:MAG: sel1 repeat family protein [Gammaproteobacteria bacterium]|nr:sel1 repeat family protein [Gammaproteobacteria bacterium]
MKILLKLFALTMAAALLSGCVGVAINGSTLALKALPRAEIEKLAVKGDADAQYELGLSHCCMGVGFDTQVATQWLCKAAAQGQRDAMYELGRIYLGEVSRTPAPVQKVLRAATAKKSPAHAYYWLSHAVELEQADAARKLRKLEQTISDTEREQAADLSPDPARVACEYDVVFAKSVE